MTLLENIKSKVKLIDLFGCNLQLSLQGEQEYKTFFGVVGTLIMIVGFLVVFVGNIMGFFQLIFISHSVQEIIDINSRIPLDSQNFKFAISLSNYDLQKSTLFKFYVQEFIRYQNGTSLTNPPLVLSKCSIQQWKHLGESFQSYYKLNGMDNYLCSPKNFSLQIQGQFGSPVFRYAKIAILPCSQADCQTRINQFVKQNRYVQYNIIYRNRAINYSNTFQPFENYPDKSFYRFIPYNTLLSVDQYITAQSVDTDISVLPFENIQRNSSYDFSKNVFFTSVPHSPKDTQFFRHFLRASPKQIEVKRKVQSLDDFLSFLGGIFSIFQIIGAFIFTPYAQFKMKSKVFNNKFFLKKRRNQFQQINQIQNPQKFSPSLPCFLFYKAFGWLDCFETKTDFFNVKTYQLCQNKAQETLDIVSIINTMNYVKKAVDYMLTLPERQILQKMRLSAISLQQQQKQLSSQQSLKKMLEQFQKKDIEKHKRLIALIGNYKMQKPQTEGLVFERLDIQ